MQDEISHQITNFNSATIEVWDGYVISTPLYRVCNDLSMQRLKLIHVSKSGTVTDIMHMIHFVKKTSNKQKKDTS